MKLLGQLFSYIIRFFIGKEMRIKRTSVFTGLGMTFISICDHFREGHEENMHESR